MVELARQLKESSLMMNQSVQQTEKVFFLFSPLQLSFLLTLSFMWIKLLWLYCTEDLLFSWSFVEKVDLFAHADP